MGPDIWVEVGVGVLSSVSQYIFNIILSFLPLIIDTVEFVIHEGAVRSFPSLSMPGRAHLKIPSEGYY